MLYAFDHSASSSLAYACGVALVVALLWRELPKDPPSPEMPDFCKLLDELEPVQEEAAFAANSLRPPFNENMTVFLRDKEALRRMSANTKVFVRLAAFAESEAGTEKTGIAHQLRIASTRLRICACILLVLSPLVWRRPGFRTLLRYIDKSYWSMVRRLHKFYGTHQIRRSSDFRLACNWLP